MRRNILKKRTKKRKKYFIKLPLVDSLLLSFFLISLTFSCKNSSNISAGKVSFKNSDFSLNAGFYSKLYSFSNPIIVEKNAVSTVKAEKETLDNEILTTQYTNYIERHNTNTVVDDDLKIKYTTADEIYETVTYPLAKIIYAEGGNQNDEFQQNVGYVVLNRVESKYYPNSIEDVFFSSDAYAETSRDRYRNNEVSEKAIENAKIVVEQYFNNAIPVSPARVFQAEFKQGIDIYQIGNTFFGSDPQIVKDMEETTK